ncbi:MAG: PH domain-containing protein [Sphingomicrobium sp.]
MSVVTTADDLSTPERLHPLFLLTGTGKVLRGAWGLIVGGAYLAFKDRWGIAFLLLGGFVVVSLVSLLIRWLTFEYRIGEHELRIDQGLLSRSSRAIPFDRVTDVDIEQGPIHRLFGLARVRMETGAAAAAKDEEGVLDTVSLARAEAIRDYVRARRRGASVIALPVVEDTSVESASIFAMDIGRVAMLGLFNFSLAILAVLFGASQTLGNLLNFDPFSRRFWMDLSASSGPLRELVMLHQAVAIIGGGIVLVIVGVATGLVRTLLTDYGFRLDRTETGFRRRRGLLTLTDVTIPARRVQATMLVTSPIRRAFGWFALKLQSLAMDAKHSDHVVAPLASFDEAAVIQQSLGRPISPDEILWKPLPVGHFTSLLVGFVPLLMISAAVGAVLTPWAFAAGGGLLIAIFVRWHEWKRARYALDGDHLFIEEGWLRQRRAIIPVARIQSIDLSENFWTRLFGFCRLKLGIAGGSILHAFQIEALTRSDAQQLRDRLLAP